MLAARDIKKPEVESFSCDCFSPEKGLSSKTKLSFRFLISSKSVKMNVVRKALIQEMSSPTSARSGHTLGRSDISGSKRKPWRQKGTGRARAGSKTGPLWKGGGVVFGPRDGRDPGARKRNRKLWRAALNYIIYNKIKHGKALVMQAPWHYTSRFLPSLQNIKLGLAYLGVGYQNCLFLVRNGVLLSLYQRAFFKGIRNVTIVPLSTVKCIDILRAEKVVIVL